MSLQNFFQQKGRPKIQIQSSQNGSLSNCLQQKNIITEPIETRTPEIKTTTPEFIKPQEKKVSKIKDTFRWVGKQLMKPVGVTAKEFRGVGEVIGSLMAIASPRVDAEKGIKTAAKSFLEAQKGAGRVIIGVEETDFLKEMEKAGVEPDKFDKVFGIGANFVLDPLWVAKPVKAIKGIAKITKFEKPAKLVSEAIKKAPAIKKLKTLFTTTTGNKEFDTIVKKFRNLKEVREADLIDDAVKLQKDIISFKKQGIKNAEELITEGLENPKSLYSISKFKPTLEKNYVKQLVDRVEEYRRITPDLDEQHRMFQLSSELLAKPTKKLVDEAFEIIQDVGDIKMPKVDEKIINIVNTLSKTYSGLLKKSKEVGLKIGEIVDYAPHIRTKESFIGKIQKEFGIGAREWGKGKVEAGRKLKGTIKELTEAGIDIFEKNPAIQLVKKGQMYAKAITSQEFAQSVKKFAIKTGDDVTHPVLKGLKFDTEVAKVIDNFYQGIKPKELKVIIKSFDKVQNWWKAQALISPSYHIRNMAGNLWNNFIAGVNPVYYKKALQLQRGSLVNKKLMKEMKNLGVIDQGWYAKDIGEEVLKRVEGIGTWKGLNPLQQENKLFQLNRNVGSAVENNARMGHYLSKIADGLSPEKAAESVKKFLFDYGDLTTFEKTIMKRFAPFYTWTRKNLPLQLESIITQPAKYVLPHKIVEIIESGVEIPNEKFMSSYITENVPVRIRKNKDGNTEYFLLGNWLPYASAIDILSQPIDTVIQMATPFLKTPIEQWANKSAFWKDTLGEYQDIERRFKQQGEFIGMSFRKKNIQLLRNIRILNDINKWIDKQDPTAVKDSFWVKTLITLFGKTATYDVGKSKYFYDMDTQDRMYELKKAIKDAQKRGFKNKANKLREELTEFQRMRQEGL